MNEREQNWQSVVDAWQSSHLSGAAFCREHGLVYHQFQYWQQKLRDSESGDKACGAQTHQLVPVQVAHRANTSEVPLQLQLPNDFDRPISFSSGRKNEKDLFYWSIDGQMKVKTYTDWGLLESEIVFVQK